MKGLPSCGSSEFTVTHLDGGDDETLDEHVGMEEAMFGGECDGKDIMVGVLGSDLYIDGVCTGDGSDAELNDEVGCGGPGGGGGSVEEHKVGGAAGVANGAAAVPFEGSQVVRSLEGKSEDEIVELDEQKNIDNREVDNKTLEKEAKSEVNDEVESDSRKSIEGQAGIDEQVGSHGEQEIEDEESDDAEQQKTKDGKVKKRASTKAGSLGKSYQASYQLPAGKEGEFSVHDMVWGKIRSHPWWPGQIFDSSDSSALAMKHFKKDCYLVAYFGDRTFAWNEVSQLKPFRGHFSYIEKQNSSETFQNAVDCALDEVRRRVEFGLACSCIPKDTYEKIRVQNVENAGIRQEVSLTNVADESLNVSSFSPEKLIEYLKTLSTLPTDGFDRLELLIAKAQLLAFYRLKGYSYLPELQCGGSLDEDNTLINDAEKSLSEINEHATHANKNDGQASTGNLKPTDGRGRKRKHNLKDGKYSEKKKRSLSELAGRTPDSPHSDSWSDDVDGNLVSPAFSKKKRTVDRFADESGKKDGRKTISLAKVSSTTKPSFKIGECIRRVASQLTAPSPSAIKRSGDSPQVADGSADGFSGNATGFFSPNLEESQRSSSTVPSEFSSLADLLSLLQLVAQEPKGDYSFLNVIMSFFSDFRNSVIAGDVSVEEEIFPTNKVGTKRKRPAIGGSPETFEFDDPGDTYWTDKAIQNGSEEQPSQRSSRKDDQDVPSEPEKLVQVFHKVYSRRRYSVSNRAEVPEKPSGYIDDKSPAELVLNFADLDSVPSETGLNKVFKRFGPLKETETEVDRGSGRARVVFKKCADAEVAFSSAKKFNIFGAVLVNYQLNYTPSALFQASSFATTQDQEMQLDLSNYELSTV